MALNQEIQKAIDRIRVLDARFRPPAGFGVPQAVVSSLNQLFAKTSFDRKLSQVEMVGKGAGASKTVTAIHGSTTLAEEFSNGDNLYLQWIPPVDFDPEQDLILNVDWFPTGSEAAKTITWVATVLVKSATLTNILGSTGSVNAVDEPVPTVYGNSTQTALTIDSATFLTGKVVDDVHIRLERVATASDPTNPPAVHHVFMDYGVL